MVKLERVSVDVNEKQSRLAKASFISRYFVSGVRTPIFIIPCDVEICSCYS
jgi:hypothetical protein